MDVREEHKELVRLVTAGSVDDGKSTLIGRLLYDCNAVYQDQIDALRARGGVGGEEIDFSLITDGLAAEREQGITIDVAYRYFSTPKRRFIIADVPGHEQYTRNMVTGASNADIALLLADASQPMSVQTRRHLFLATLLRIPHIVVVANKMDAVGYTESAFERLQNEVTEYAAKLPVRDLQFIPISALRGDMIVKRFERMPWYQGRTLYDYLTHVQVISDRNLIDTRFPVQYVIRVGDEFRGYAGCVEGGVIRKGDDVRLLPSGRKITIASLFIGAKEVGQAHTSQSVTVTLAEDVDVSRGDMMVRPNNIPQVGRRFDAQLCWFAEEALETQKTYLLKQTSQVVRCRIEGVAYQIDIDTQHRKQKKEFVLNDIGRVTVHTTTPLYFDPYGKNRSTGSFILIDELTKQTVAAGMILQKQEEEEKSEAATHQTVLWLTGLSGSGKTTLAEMLTARLTQAGVEYEWLDGDRFRELFHNDLSFSQEDRVKNIQRAGAVANMLSRHNILVIGTFITPYHEQRQWLREHVPGYTEVFVDAPLAVCQERDVKGLYKQAATGTVGSFTGVSDMFETPSSPDLHLETHIDTPEVCVDKIMALLRDRQVL